MVQGITNLIGKIDTLSTVEGHGEVIVTDRVAGSFNPQRFPVGTLLELRDSQGNSKRLHIKSPELTLRDGEDYLSFIVQDRIDENELNAFDEVWCETKIEHWGGEYGQGKRDKGGISRFIAPLSDCHTNGVRCYLVAITSSEEQE